jgi:hypothetical protein
MAPLLVIKVRLRDHAPNSASPFAHTPQREEAHCRVLRADKAVRARERTRVYEDLVPAAQPRAGVECTRPVVEPPPAQGGDLRPPCVARLVRGDEHLAGIDRTGRLQGRTHLIDGVGVV